MCYDLRGMHMHTCAHNALRERVPPGAPAKNSGAIMLNDAPESL